MHAVIGLLPFITLAVALPSGTNLAQRDLLDEQCTIGPYKTPTSTNGLQCRLPSDLTQTPPNPIDIPTVKTSDGSFDECQKECLRNADCLATTWTTDGLCFLWGNTLRDMGSVPDNNSEFIHTSRDCNKLVYKCLPHEGSFESKDYPDDPFYNGTVHPWSQNKFGSNDDESGFQLVVEGTAAAKHIKKSPAGSQFAKAKIYNSHGFSELHQVIQLPANTLWRMEFWYNFVSYVQLSGKQKPSHYNLFVELSGIGAPIDLKLPLSAANNRWIKKTVDFSTESSSPNFIGIGINTGLFDELNSEFVATFAVDGLSITPA